VEVNFAPGKEIELYELKLRLKLAAGSFSGSWAAQQLSRPQDIATNGADLWILDSGTNRVCHYANAAARLAGTQARGQLQPGCSQ
jgi:hypothetical protein